MNGCCKKLSSLLSSLSHLPPLIFRLVLAYGFYDPAMKKLADIESFAGFLGSMNFPFPLANAYLAAGTEAAGVVLLTLGLFTRLISIPLMFVMIIAISTVHLGSGFQASNNGFEIPLYYLLMLFSLLVTGAGKYSIDGILGKKCCGCSSESCEK